MDSTKLAVKCVDRVFLKGTNRQETKVIINPVNWTQVDQFKVLKFRKNLKNLKWLSKSESEVNKRAGYVFINHYLCLDEGWLSLSDWPTADQTKLLLICNQSPAATLEWNRWSGFSHQHRGRIKIWGVTNQFHSGTSSWDRTRATRNHVKPCCKKE